MLPFIAERRSDPDLATRTDVLSVLLKVRDEDGNGLSDSAIRDDLVTLVLAGHETTATTLSWLFDALLHRPEVLARVRAEAETGETGYTHAVINETLRLRPPVPFTSRVTTTSYRLGDHVLEPGTRIVLYIDAVNKNPKTYAQPHEFHAERFLHQRPNMYAWIPFGGGLKRCLGASFSMIELTTVLHTLLLHGDFRPASTKEESPVRRSVVVVPRNGTRLFYRPRESEK
ncbi:cytochrome P450 [Hoyosella altamirensis]|uniref:Cytochrome P450 n=1 Tax=Hoyosella altamirensis TaxID=616997 RepID=A0A839RLB6_9ACTN|nr:cytochrome P450 [Hoyosella altamirensis]